MQLFLRVSKTNIKNCNADTSSLHWRFNGCEGFSPILQGGTILLPNPMISLRLPLKKLAENQAFSHPLSLKRRSGIYLQQRTWRQRLRPNSLIWPLIYPTTIFPRLHPCLRRSCRRASRGKAKAAYRVLDSLRDMKIFAAGRKGQKVFSDTKLKSEGWLVVLALGA